MVLNSAGEKGLLLGACFRSHVCVVLFSDLNVMPVLQQPSRNHLSKHMEHLPFASAFWVLQVIVSLRCKFQGVYTQKQLIGSKKGSSVCWHNTGMSSHPSDHTCDSAPRCVQGVYLAQSFLPLGRRSSI
jgi:hypothetical protein